MAKRKQQQNSTEPKARDLFQLWCWKRYANAAYTQKNKRALASRKACRGRVES